MRFWPLFAVCLAAVAYPFASANAADTVDAWEGSDAQERALRGCIAIDQSLFAPVPSAHRAEAISKLEKIPVAALSEKQATAILALESDPSMASAPDRIKATIKQLREQKRLELDEKIGSWGQVFQERLSALEALDASLTPRDLKPYLVRAIGKNEFTGGFYISVCGKTVAVTHGSLGRGPTPPTIHLPIVVFLGDTPKSVVARWAMAE